MKVGINTLWKHGKSGTEYKVILVTNEHAEKPGYPVTVCYTSGDGKVWSRTLEGFLEAMEPVEKGAYDEYRAYIAELNNTSDNSKELGVTNEFVRNDAERRLCKNPPDRGFGWLPYQTIRIGRKRIGTQEDSGTEA